MDNLIKRSDAKDAVIKQQGLYGAVVDDICERIESIPSADRPQGEAPLEHGYMWTCPKCELEVHSDFDTCPRCGYEREDRPQGEWIDIGTFSHSYKCSVCGRTLFNITVGKNHVAKYYPYCHCGAKMKGADDE